MSYKTLFIDTFIYFRFYICCDKCQDWFHGSCVGVLQCEGDKMDDYNCPRCMSNSEINFANLNPLNQQDNDDLLKLIKQIHVIIYH